MVERGCIPWLCLKKEEKWRDRQLLSVMPRRLENNNKTRGWFWLTDYYFTHTLYVVFVSVDVVVLFQVKDLSGQDSTQPSLLKEVFVSIAWAIEFIRHPSAWRTMMKWYWVTKENHAFLSVISIGFYLIKKRGEKEKFSMKSGKLDFSSIEKKNTRIMAE